MKGPQNIVVNGLAPTVATARTSAALVVVLGTWIGCRSVVAVQLETQDGLTDVVEIAGRHEPETLVERRRAAIELGEAAGEQLRRACVADEPRHRVHRVSSVAPAL